MPDSLNRRRLLAAVPALGVAALASRSPLSAFALSAPAESTPAQPAPPLADADRALLLGTYRFGPAENETIAVAVGKLGLTFERAGTSPRLLSHVGGRAFFPAGASPVRIRFSPATGRANELTVHDPDLVLTARKA